MSFPNVNNFVQSGVPSSEQKDTSPNVLTELQYRLSPRLPHGVDAKQHFKVVKHWAFSPFSQHINSYTNTTSGDLQTDIANNIGGYSEYPFKTPRRKDDMEFTINLPIKRLDFVYGSNLIEDACTQDLQRYALALQCTFIDEKNIESPANLPAVYGADHQGLDVALIYRSVRYTDL